VATAHHLRSFLPIVRFSRGMMDCYVRAVESGGWRGHTEALYPTIASFNSLVIEDLGGKGPFTRPSMFGKNYVNTPTADGDLLPGTFVYRPVKNAAYFHEAPERFSQPGYLYHPVKVPSGSVR
jgi:hypothetical protein